MTASGALSHQREAHSPRPRVSGGAGGHVLVWLVIAASVGLLFLTGDPRIALGPPIVAAAAYAFLHVPIRWTLFSVLTATVTVEILPISLPNSDTQKWYSPLYPLYTFFFDNLNNIVPVDALRFSATEVLFAAMLVLAVLRYATGERIDARDRGKGSVLLYLAVAISFASVLALELWGIARGGDFRQSLWQARQLFWLPPLTCLFSYCLRDSRDTATAVGLLFIASFIKIAIGLYYMISIAWPAHSPPVSLTSHNDSLVFVVVIVAAVAYWVHAPSRNSLLLSLLVSGWLMLGMVLNDRRIAYVGLAVSLLLLYVVLRGPVKRSVTRLVLCSLPVLFLYLAAGRNHNSGFFKVAGLVNSVVSQKDRSSETRDIENTNLLYTLKQSKVLGAGWGHEYIELVKADDISRYFQQYRFIAHNSILWIWSIGGLVGFTLISLPFGVGIFLARRAYTFARSARERTVAVVVLAALATYLIQAWGDMGTQGLTCTLIAALALATSGKLAVATGAVPSMVRLHVPRGWVHASAALTAPGTP